MVFMWTWLCGVSAKTCGDVVAWQCFGVLVKPAKQSPSLVKKRSNATPIGGISSGLVSLLGPLAEVAGLGIVTVAWALSRLLGAGSTRWDIET
ncbi:hypothetical protein NL676_036432 [Syzygium grande]|nr:hypothetical protein NL676_036432 [Syzygium grande]